MKNKGVSLKNNKKGAIGLILFFVILFVVLILGFMGAIILGVIDFGSDEIIPVMKEIGIIGDTNVSEASEYTFGTLETVNSILPLMFGLLYVGALIFSIVFAISYSFNPHPVFIGLYFVLLILLIFGSIIMSNMYQDIYTGTDELATRLQDQGLMSFMILRSPYILALIAVITGIYLFSRQGTGETGGYGI